MTIKKIIRVGLLALLISLALGYGILIGKYQVFPYKLLKNFQDLSEENIPNALENIKYSQSDLGALVSVNSKNSDSLRQELKQLIFWEP